MAGAFEHRSGDDGVDVVAIRDREGLLVQCKSSSVAAAEIGWDAVKDVVGGAAAYSSRYPGVRFRKVCATNQRFNANARRHAELNDVDLQDQATLLELLSAYPTHLSDIDSLLYSGWNSSGSH
jgi:HJR/Mrr/RecB family endonuclease